MKQISSYKPTVIQATLSFLYDKNDEVIFCWTGGAVTDIEESSSSLSSDVSSINGKDKS